MRWPGPCLEVAPCRGCRSCRQRLYVVVIGKLEAAAPGETNAGWQRPGKAEPEPIGISPGGRWHPLCSITDCTAPTASQYTQQYRSVAT